MEKSKEKIEKIGRKTKNTVIGKSENSKIAK